MKQIRMRRDVLGTHLGDPNGSLVGDVLEVDDGIAEAYVLHGLAELVEEKKVSPTPLKVETAVAPVAVEVETATAPSPEHPHKRGPGRPRKA